LYAPRALAEKRREQRTQREAVRRSAIENSEGSIPFAGLTCARVGRLERAKGLERRARQRKSGANNEPSAKP